MSNQQNYDISMQDMRITMLEQENKEWKAKFDNEKAEKLRLSGASSKTNREILSLKTEAAARDADFSDLKDQLAHAVQQANIAQKQAEQATRVEMATALELLGMKHIGEANELLQDEATRANEKHRNAVFTVRKRDADAEVLKKEVEAARKQIQSLETEIRIKDEAIGDYELMVKETNEEIVDLKKKVAWLLEEKSGLQQAAEQAADEMADLHVTDTDTIAELRNAAVQDAMKITELQEQLLKATLTPIRETFALSDAPTALPFPSANASARPIVQVENPIASMFKTHATAIAVSATASNHSSSSTLTESTASGGQSQTSSALQTPSVSSTRSTPEAGAQVFIVAKSEFSSSPEVHLTINLDVADKKRWSLLQHARDALSNSTKLTVLGSEKYVNAFLTDLSRVQKEYATQASDIVHWQQVAARTMEEVNSLQIELNTRPLCAVASHASLEMELEAKGEELVVELATNAAWVLKMDRMRTFVNKANAEMFERRRINAQLYKQ